MDDRTDNRAAVARGGRVIRAGVVIVLIAIGVMLLPLLLGRWEPSKYIVAIGFLLACWGLGCILNGVLDLWRK